MNWNVKTDHGIVNKVMERLLLAEGVEEVGSEPSSGVGFWKERTPEHRSQRTSSTASAKSGHSG
jgi:hypothetical protein